MRLRKWWGLVAGLVALAMVAGCGANNQSKAPNSTVPGQPGQSEQRQPIKVRVGVSGQSVNYIHFWLAHVNGFFKEEGLEIETIIFDGGPPTVQAMIAGEIPIAVSSSYEVVSSRLEGSDLKVVATFVPNAPHLLIAKPEIKTPADLKGKKVGVSKIGAESHKAAQAAVEMIGLKATDVVFLATGGQTTRVQTLLAGTIDATVVSPPGTGDLQRKGYNILADLIAGKLVTAHENIITRDKVIKENPEMIRRLLKGLARGIHYFHTNPEGTKKYMAEYLQMDPVKTKDDIDAAYADYVANNAPRVPYPAVEGLKRQLTYMAEAKNDPKVATMDPGPFHDSSFIKELDESGFISKLYGK